MSDLLPWAMSPGADHSPEAYIMALAVTGAAALLAIVAGLVLPWWLDRRAAYYNLRAAVWSNLDSVAENGYFNHGEQLYEASPEDVAEDMLLYAVDFEGDYLVGDILPHVRTWMGRHGLLL